MAAQSAIWVNGKRDSSLALPDRGLNFGDGLFETLLVDSGRILHIERHLYRLQLGMAALEISSNLDELVTQLNTAAAEFAEAPWAAMRLTLTRGAGPRGYLPPDSDSQHSQFVIEVSPIARDCGEPEEPARLGLAELRLALQPALAGIKHLNRLEQVLAAQQLAKSGFREGVLLDTQDHIVSVVAGNIFALKGGCIVTPALHYCGIAGTRRALLMERWAPALGLDVIETKMTLSDLESAEEVFYTNALFGVRSVASVGRVEFPGDAVAQRLFQVYRDEQA